MTVDELACKELVELVTEYLEDTLPSAERARFDAHLKKCDGCHTYLEQMRQTIRALGTLEDETVTEEAKRILLEAFRSWKKD
jgi:anti-sigma factor RsiW